VHVYNVLFFDQLLRLLKAQCVYCHRLQMSRVQVKAYICKLRLLQYGLIDDVAVIDEIGTGKISGESEEHAGDSGREQEDPDDLMDRKIAYVKRCIHKAQRQGRIQGLAIGAKNPIAVEKRRALVKEFFRDIVSLKKCTSCNG
jgi:DNA-directed RNA polymerase I subunit RPA1